MPIADYSQALGAAVVRGFLRQSVGVQFPIPGYRRVRLKKARLRI